MLMEVRTVKSVSLVSSETEGCPCAHPPGVSNSAKLKTNESRKRSARKLLQDCGSIGLRVVYELALREVKQQFSVVSYGLSVNSHGTRRCSPDLEAVAKHTTGHEAASVCEVTEN